MSPLCTQRWGHVGLPLSTLSISVCARTLYTFYIERPWSVSPIHFGPPCRVWCHAECGPASQTAGNINPALVQSTPVPPA